MRLPMTGFFLNHVFISILSASQLTVLNANEPIHQTICGKLLHSFSAVYKAHCSLESYH